MNSCGAALVSCIELSTAILFAIRAWVVVNKDAPLLPVLQFIVLIGLRKDRNSESSETPTR
jgi:hypothetical protein